MEFVIGTKADEALANQLLSVFQHMPSKPGTLYIGYPVLPTEGSHHRIDGLYVSSEHGVVIFHLVSSIATDQEWEDLKSEQDQVFAAMLSKLSRTPQLLERRKLAVPIHIITFVADESVKRSVEAFVDDDDTEEVVVACPADIRDILSNLDGLRSPSMVEVLNAAIERVLTIKPRKRRDNVKKKASRGAILKEIEQQIANLDRDQKKGAIECPEGPQRIRGLAGSGKTIVLALKAAYLHAEHPDWTIAVSFFTRSLHQQFEDLIRRFYFDQTQDNPDWSRIQLLPAWGSARSPGLYSKVASANNIAPVSFDEAKSRYGSGPEAFEGACEELLAAVPLKGSQQRALFDAVLIDEAQDLPRAFFRIAWLACKAPHRVVWAYDELQNLGNFLMPSPEELFGKDGTRSLVELRREQNRPNPDVVLPKCYRNTPWVLTAAHALGLRVYGPSLAQWVEQFELWKAIGYELREGDFLPGHRIVLKRRADSTPEFFERLIAPEDSLQWHACESEQEQLRLVAEAIEKNIRDDELDPDDILVIFANPLTVRSVAPKLQSLLFARKINSHIAGVTTSADDFFVLRSVTISSILRAKGNEAPMVYVVDAQHCATGAGKADLARKRNILFTALTRSRAWVRLFGYGPAMKKVAAELLKVVDHDYTLDFRYPEEGELQALRLLGKDMTEQELKETGDAERNIDQVVESIKNGRVKLENISRERRELLIRMLEGGEEDV